MGGACASTHTVSCALMDVPSELSDVAQEVAWRSAQDEKFGRLRSGTEDGAPQGPVGGSGGILHGCRRAAGWQLCWNLHQAGRVSVTHLDFLTSDAQQEAENSLISFPFPPSSTPLLSIPPLPGTVTMGS